MLRSLSRSLLLHENPIVINLRRIVHHVDWRPVVGGSLFSIAAFGGTLSVMCRYGAGFALWSAAAKYVVLFTVEFARGLVEKAGAHIPTLPDWMGECGMLCIDACSECLVPASMRQYAHVGHSGLVEALLHAALYRLATLLGQRALIAIGPVHFNFTNNWPDFACCVRGVLFFSGAMLPFWLCNSARAYLATK